ncbi:MAG: hypothetical protein JRH20_25890 [Deltaproteobacteria bacterium]|nr:hypothetical protein [Deltaproteobacteria bacterium]
MRINGAALVLVVGVITPSLEAQADHTSLLKVNLRTGKRSSIDKAEKRQGADAALDALLDSSTGKSFSTADLGRIEKAVRRFLQQTRPRAAPRLLLFLYPGNITSQRLRTLREISINIDLVVDPCARAICRGSVAKHLEILGRAIKQAVIRTQDYVIRFKTVTVRTSTAMRGARFDIYSFSAKEVVDAGQGGRGQKLVRRVLDAQEGYAREMTRKTAKNVARKRVRLAKSPRVIRDGERVTVDLELRSDRVRYKRHVVDALAGAMKALRSSKLTPQTVQLKVVALIPMRGMSRKVFSCLGQAVDRYRAGRLSSGDLWASYITREGGPGRRMSFSAGEASGRASTAADSAPDRTQEILSKNVARLAPCLQKEAARNRRFKGVTLEFSVDGRGRAGSFSTRERAGKKLKHCLQRALGQIAFQRHGGAPRRVSYPLFIRR